MIVNFLLVGIGGAFGSMLRYYISMRCNKHFIGTWIANVSGSLLLGLLVKFYVADYLSEAVWLLAGVGFCGAYTTFSTFGNETIQMLLARKFSTAIIYVVSSFLISIFLVSVVWIV